MPSVAFALALHIFGAVVWVGGMFAIYVGLRSALGPCATGCTALLELGRLLLEPFSLAGKRL